MEGRGLRPRIASASRPQRSGSSGSLAAHPAGRGVPRRASLLVALLFLAGVFLGTVTFLPATVRGATLYVGGVGPANYTVIQYAIENATAGDTVFVYAGRYLENVEVDKAISLVGEDRNTTIIDGRNQGTVVNVTASGVTVTGLTVTNGSSEGTSAGIVLAGVRDSHVSGNNITANIGNGVYANSSSNNVVEGNVFWRNGGYGALFASSSNDTVDSNEFLLNRGALSIALAVNTTVTRNVVAGGYGPFDILLGGSDRVAIANNTLTDRTQSRTGLEIMGSTNATIANNTIDSYFYGVELRSGKAVVAGNRVTGSQFCGVHLWVVYDNAIENNTFVGGRYGVCLETSARNLIRNNSFSSPSYGIALLNSNSNHITSNILAGSLVGIMTRSSGSNIIANNTLSSIVQEGIDLTSSSADSLADNTFLDGLSRPVIVLNDSLNIRMDRNALAGGGIYISGDQVVQWDTHAIAPSNTVGGRPVYYWHNASGGTIPAGAGQVLLGNVSGVTVETQNFSGAFVGIQAGFSSGLVIRNNTASDSGWAGVELDYSSNSSVLGNVIWNSTAVGNGIDLYHSRGITVAGNRVSNNYYGIILESSGSITLSGNTVTSSPSGSGAGVFAQRSDDVVITGNSLSRNPVGVSAAGGTRGSILNNSVLDNGRGLNLDGLGDIWNIVGNTLSRNFVALAIGNVSQSPAVFHNNFVNNTQQTLGASIGSLDNGYPSGGNFWSDYVGIDNRSGPMQDQPGGDGIGDTPYLTQLGTDRYPLMYMVMPPPLRPSRPQFLQATAGDRRVVLNWTTPAADGGSPVTNYTVYRAFGSGPVTPLVEIGPVLSYTDTGLAAGLPYRYALTARNAVGSGPISNEAAATPYTFPGAPRNLTAAGSNQQVVLSWLAPASDGFSPITNYTVYRGVASGGETFLVRLGDVRTYTDTGLTNGVTYYFRIAAVNAAGEGPNSTEASATPIATPSDPLGLTATAGDARVTLNWNPPATDGGLPITNYRIYRGTSPGSETFLVQLGAALTYLDTGLTNGVTYYYTVTARNAAGEGPASNEASATPVTVPSEPRSLIATAGLQQITLEWLPPATDGGLPVTDYRVYRGTSPGTETFLVQLGNVVTLGDPGLGDGHTFCYLVRAVNGVGEGPASFEACATTPSRPPAPVNLRAVGGDARIVLTWSLPPSDGGSPITGYRVYRGTASGAETPLLLLGAVLTYTDAGVSNGITYYYEVAAVNAVGEGPVSGEASATAAARPSAPLALQATGGAGRVTLTWTAPSSDGGSPITGYRVYRGTAPGGESLFAPIGTVLSYTDITVVGGRRYSYQVSAVNLAGEGPRSSEANGTAFMAPGIPRSPIATVTGGQIHLTWSAPSDDGGSPITAYRVYRGTQAGGETLWSTEGVVLSFVDAAASIGVTYYYQVSASNAAGEGPRSSEVRAVIANVPPACAIGAPEQHTLVSGVVTISGTAGDADGTVRRVEVRIDNGLWAVAQGTTNWTYSWDTRNVTDGTHTIWARSYDGLAYSQDSSVSVLLRNGPPPPPPAETPVWQQPWLWGVVGVVLVVMLLGYRLFRKEEGKKGREK